jgi:hypothetical protein
MDIGKLNIARIKLEKDEKLLVQLPDDTEYKVVSKFAEHFSKVFPAGSFLIFTGDVEFTKVEKGDENGKFKSLRK